MNDKHPLLLENLEKALADRDAGRLGRREFAVLLTRLALTFGLSLAEVETASAWVATRMRKKKGASGLPFSLNYLGKTMSAISGSYTFGAADPGRCLVTCLAWQYSGASSVTSCTIGGVSATILVQSIQTGGTRGCCIAAAMVPSGTSGSVSASGPSVFSSRAANYLYSIYGVSAVSALTQSSLATNPAATFATVNANSALICVTMAGGPSSPSISWTGPTANSTDPYSQQASSVASKLFTSSASNYAITASDSGSVGSSGCFALFQ